jgi:insertion element IS1 protein InsB
MAAGMTDHVWTTNELLSYRVSAAFLAQLQESEHLFPSWDELHHGRWGTLPKKESTLSCINHRLLALLNPDEVEVVIRLADEAEVDEMWSFVQRKQEPRWLWHAIDHRRGQVLAYVFGRRQDEVFLQLKTLLEPFGITRYYTDHWGAYTRHLDLDEHQPGKRNTQKIERKHLALRTRMKRFARKTICFSKSIQMHDLVIGLFVNRYEFGFALHV